MLNGAVRTKILHVDACENMSLLEDVRCFTQKGRAA